MKINPDLFAAYLKCPTKCWLRSRSETGGGNEYADWVRIEAESYRHTNAKRLIESIPDYECAIAPLIVEKPDARSANNPNGDGSLSRPLSSTDTALPADAYCLKTAKWRLAVELPVQTQDLESRLHAAERAPSEGRGKFSQIIPIRFVFTNKLTKDDRLLVAFDALVLSDVLGREVTLGKIIHGDDHTTRNVKASKQFKEVRKRVENIATLLQSQSPPDLVLNRHCAECEFQKQCRQKAVEKDDLSLLANMTEQERKKFRSKGIFTVTQLSYTFRPRRRPKRQRNKREKYHHALKALAIREKKIHIVGDPELKIEGTPVYLDVEGLPDRDFYYLIGVRTGNGESAVQHSLWADTVEDEGKIWREFLGILETIEKPVLIHYGSYEAIFLRRMSERHGNPLSNSSLLQTIENPVNLLSVIYAQIYFPVWVNSLKELANCVGFKWSETEPSGIKTIIWRHNWELSHSLAVKQRLLLYNAEDCGALERIYSVLGSIGIQKPATDHSSVADLQIVRAEAVKDERLRKWREFKSPFSEFEMMSEAAHWNYQHDRVITHAAKLHEKGRRRTCRKFRKGQVFKIVMPKTSRICPDCKKRLRCKCVFKIRHRYELFFGRSSMKVRLVKFVLPTYYCRRCKLTLGEETSLRGWHRFGWSLIAYFMYQIIDLNIPQRMVARNFSRLFSIVLSYGTIHTLKRRAAEHYHETRQRILDRIRTGNLVHADETKIHLQGTSGYVWVLTNLHEVAYVYADTREGELPQTLLSAFTGVLVSDFYAAYDAINCKQQKCLIHLIRDLNDEVLDHPYDEELKSIVKTFGSLIQPMIETVARRGLKRYFLRKHLLSVNRFYRQLSQMVLSTEAAQKCRQRFEKNRDCLFTFLEHDGIPWNNNNAEHAIKAVARLRNIITGVSTVKGFDEYLVLLSVCQTCEYQGIDFLDFLRSGEKDITAFAESHRSKRKRSALLRSTATLTPTAS